MNNSRSRKLSSLAAVCALLIAFVVTAVFANRIVDAAFAGAAASKSKLAVSESSVAQGIAARYGELPLRFEPNEGQSDQRVKFLSRGPGYDLFLTANCAILTLQKPQAPAKGSQQLEAANDHSNPSPVQSSVLRLEMLGANTGARVTGQDQLTGKINYLIGADQEQWHTNIPTYGKVRYEAIYPGVDLVYYGNRTELEYDFVVKPEGDLQAIRFQFEGADKIGVDASGDLKLTIEKSEVKLRKPIIYQLTDTGERHEVKGTYLLKGKQVGFKVGSFDSSKPLVIDPVLSYSTLLGAGSDESANGIAVDSSGNAYITGVTNSSNFPTTPGALQTTGPTSSAFVSKLDPTGTNLVYSTYLSGSAGATANAIAIDATGNAYVTGYTSSEDFPAVTPLKTKNSFFKTTDGAANWNNNNTGLSGNLTALAVAPNSPSTIYAGTSVGAYVSTDAGSTWQKTATGGLPTFPNVITLAVDPTNSQVVYAGILNGGLYRTTNGGATWARITLPVINDAVVFAIAFDPLTPATMYLGSGNGAFKSTNSGNSWTQLSFGSPATPNVRALAIDPISPATIYAGTFGSGFFKTINGGTNWTAMNSGMNGTTITAIAIDPSNTSTVYAGHSGSIDKSINGATSWSPINTGVPGFAISALIVDPSAPATVYAGTTGGGVIKTTNGGSSWARVNAGLWKANIVALVRDPTNPATLYAAAGSTAGEVDVFVSELNSSGSALLFSTFLGGSASDFGYGIALDGSGLVYVAGQTQSTNFPTVNASQSTPGSFDSCGEAFVAKLNLAAPAIVYSTYLGGGGCDIARAIASDMSGNAYVTGNTSSANFPTLSAFQPTRGSQFSSDVFVTKFNSGGTLGYSTYLGGANDQTGFGIAVDSSGNAYVTGVTSSGNFPTANPIQGANAGFGTDAFVTKLNPGGSGLVYSTYLGGSGSESGQGIAVDATGSAFVTGYTASTDFPLVVGTLLTKSPFHISTDNGAHWSDDNFGVKGGTLNSIVLDPVSPSTIYAGTSGGVYKSTDGGNNWIANNNGLGSIQIVQIVVDPLTPSNVYAVTDNSIYKSTNSGGVWAPASSGLFNVNVLAIDPLTPATLYAGVDGNGVFKSVNGGANWAPTGSPAVTAESLAIDPTTPTTLYFAGANSNGGIFKSIDAGATWQKVGFSQTGPNASFVAISPINPAKVFAITSTGLFRSIDGGVNWTSLGAQPSLPRKIVFDPLNATTVYQVSPLQGILRSTDDGQTWRAVNNGLRSASATALTINAANPTTLYAGVSALTDDDAFVSKLNPAGSTLVYSTLLGGSPITNLSDTSSDIGKAIALDSAGNAYVAGSTRSPGFLTTSNSYQPFNRGFSDAFVAKIGMSYVISGQVLDASNAPISGAIVSLSDGTSISSVTTDSSGSYLFSHLREGGSFTVSAAKPHFTMAPQSQTFNNLTSNQTVNFIATATNAVFYTINGTVTNNGLGLSGVQLTLSGSQAQSAISDANANYSFTLAGGGDYTVTPGALGFTFTPPNQTFNNLSADQTANFTANRQNFVVTNVNNHGTGSFRQTILDANATAGTDTITFNIPGGGIQTINLLVALPEVTDPVIIDGTTQPGYSGSPLVELNGASVSGGNGYGLVLKGGDSTVRGLAIGRFSAGGIWLNSSNNNTIQGNYIGLDPTGTIKRANPIGILFSSSSNNLIGGVTAAARNVISGNGDGVAVTGTNNVVQGNFIGTDPTGTIALGNGTSGVSISGSPAFTNNLIGGTAAGAGNLISGNQRGVYLFSPGNSVQGNLIGTDVTGTKKLGNSTGINATGANTLIGGLTPGSRNVISGNSADGVVFGGAGSRLQGNFIGTDITGSVALGNGGSGVVAGNLALIGGTTPEARNIISGNGGSGNISLGSNNAGSETTVQGNYIGTDVTGNVALAPPGPSIFSGITVSSSINNVIGGLVPGAQNVISGNTLVGIDLDGSTVNNTIQGNIIGLNAAGTAPLANAFGGIRVSWNNNLIGGDQAGAANRIGHNGGPGVYVSSGTGNIVRGNSIFSNGELGIDLGLVGINANDLTDPDTGGNNLQNFPLLSSVISDGAATTVQGSLNSAPNTTFRIDFYSNAACDPSGNGEGAQFMGNTNVTTAADGNAVVNVTLPTPLPTGRTVVATATDPNGNTSEFSACNSSQTAGSIQFSSASYFSLEDVGNLIITVMRTGGTKGTLSVNYASADGTALAGSDYTAVSGTLVFADGETSKTFTVPVVNDGVTEPDETFRLILGGITNLENLGNPNPATVTLQANTTPLYVIVNPTTPLDTIDVVEGNSGTTNAIVTVGLSSATGRTVTADYATTSGTATSGVDFTPVSGTLTFAPGVTRQSFSFPIIGDTLNELNETVPIVLSNVTNASTFQDAFVRIINDDPLPGLSINDVSVTEGNSGTSTLNFTVSLLPVSGRTVRVNYATANSTATATSDFVGTSGQLTFNAGETSKTVAVTINGDTTVEGDETFFVDLTTPVAASITRSRGTGTITNDDGATSVSFSTANYSKSEGGGSTNITVTRTGDISGASSVEFRTGGNSFVACDVLGGLAVQNCDFVVSAGTLTFAAGQASRTFPVMIYDDAYVEGNETLSLTLMNPVGATLGSLSTASLMILDNDSAGAPSIAAKTFVATLSSGQEVPPTGTNGKGGGLVQLDALETGAKVGLLFSNLSSAEMDAHIHGPAAPGANAPILFPLPAGTFNGFGISPTAQQVGDLKANLDYMNVHSSNFTGGEIRGQLLWNPLNEAQYFVQQHYFDFLGRLPDQGGLDYWTNELNVCGTDVQCLRDRSVGVSNAFFYEDEYQQTASYVFLLYRASFGNTQPFPNPDPANPTEANKLPRYLSFVRDRAQVVGGSGLAASQLALANNFVQRPEFVTKYPSSLSTGAQFVDAVLANIQSADGASFAAADRTGLITHFNNGGRGLVMFHLANDYWNGCSRLPGSPSAPCVPAGMGAAVDNRVFIDAEYNRSFVYSQYSGYLRRDSDIDGFIFWLNQVSGAPPRNVAKQHGMVCAFITSAEYQLRFGAGAPRTNAECVP
ncbi:MAG: hypothetical protein QOE77_1068 [Blastocatellia bacterium]|jgi:hypothetical protein|nr:hypothetical protein [Blastocatellia bacterium]